MKTKMAMILLLFTAVACNAATLQELSEQYNLATSILESERREKITALSKDYLASLDKLKQQLASRGDLDGALAARNEIERVNRGSPPPSGNTGPAWLIASQKKYEQEVQQATKTISGRADGLKQKHLQDLAALQNQLTVAGDLDGAVAVRTAKEKFAASVGKPVPSAAASPVLPDAAKPAWAAAPTLLKPSRAPSAGEITVLPYTFQSGLKETKLDPQSRGMFDELTVEMTDRLRIHGTKRQDSARVADQTIFHLGKMAFIPLRDKSGKIMDRSGKLVAKLGWQEDGRYYWLAFEFQDKLNTAGIKLEAGMTYDWSIKSERGTTELHVVAAKDGGTKTKGTRTRQQTSEPDVANLKAPTDQIKGFGFGATVRSVKHQADIEATFD